MTTPKEKARRLKVYASCSSDVETAAKLGLTVSGWVGWRRKNGIGPKRKVGRPRLDKSA